ncbi:unnamed protein product [Cuscuta campestris]|uniref:Uncharacterized protein n=1 Tax=Cuscuta campestris TaxID=132261 RepID=A0A484MU84_9ASTE|nr:unnamed protein product [Cuscuta campestris]
MSCGGGRKGPPKHQNSFAWKPNAGKKINESELGGRFKPYSEITGVCARCKGQIDWKRKYGKYKPLTEPAKCQKCSKRNVRQAYHNICNACAKEHNVCAKCSCQVSHIIGRDLSEVEAEKKILEEAIKNARERDRRSLLRSMNKGKSLSSGKSTCQNDKVGELVPESPPTEQCDGYTHDHNDAMISKQNDEKHGYEEEEDNDDHEEGTLDNAHSDYYAEEEEEETGRVDE